MGKQRKKQQKHQKRKKVNKFQRICEICGNDVLSFKRVYKCLYCGLINGLPDRVEITRGRVEE